MWLAHGNEHYEKRIILLFRIYALFIYPLVLQFKRINLQCLFTLSTFILSVMVLYKVHQFVQ